MLRDGHVRSHTNSPCEWNLEWSISSNIVLYYCALVVKEDTPPINILGTPLHSFNIFEMLKAILSSRHCSSIEMPKATFLRPSYDICSTPWISTFGIWSKNLQPSYGSHCLANNRVVLWLITSRLIRKAWLKLILLRGARSLIFVPSTTL